jgi:hypothetical protein
MRVKEFKEMSDTELLQMADDCFANMPVRGSQEHPGLLLQAQFYMNEVDRRNESKISRRDFRMELTVIALILLEVIIGIGGIVFGIVEGNKQVEILNRMNASTAATATATQGVNTASQDQATKLKNLSDEQTKSLDSLREMNDKLQSSVKQTTDMAVAMQEQLKILKEEQANRLAQLAKKPRLEINVGSTPLRSAQVTAFNARELTDSKAVYDVSLINLGDATATKGTLRIVILAKDVSLESSALGTQRVYEEPNSDTHTFLIPFDYIRPNVRIPMSIVFNYQKRQQPFVVMFNVDADEISAGTFLGALPILPPQPVN